MQLESTVLPAAWRAQLEAMPPRGRARPALDACEAIAFTRVSTSVQESRPDQLAEIEKDAGRYGVPVTLHLGGEHPRWVTTGDDYRDLYLAIDSRRYSHLWLFKADRLGGEDADFIKMVRYALRAGMRVRDTIIGEVNDENVAFLGMLSHMEIKAVSQRTIMRLEALAERGSKLGSIPVGYQAQCTRRPCKCGRHGYPEKDPVLAPLVRKLFERYDQGETLGVLQVWFNGATGGRRDLWSMRQILRNPYYWGLNVGCRERHSMVLKRYARPKEEWKVTMHDQPLVDKALFDRVQARLDAQAHLKGAHVGQRTKHSLAGLLWCARCGRRLGAHRTGPTSWVWRCPLCYKTRGTQRMERAVRDCLDRIPVPAQEAAAHYADRLGTERAELVARLQGLDAGLAKLGRRRTNLRCQYADQDPPMTREELQESLTETAREQAQLQEQRSVLQRRLDSLPAHQDLARTIVQRLQGLARWTDGLDKQEIAEQQRMYRECLARMDVDFGEGTLTVTYTPAVAGWYGRASDTVPLPNQKAPRSPQTQ